MGLVAGHSLYLEGSDRPAFRLLFLLEKRLTLEVNDGEENRTKTKASLAKDPQVHSAAVQEKVHRKNNSLQKEIGAGSTQFLNI
jgi:hypothetical protein